MTSSGKRADGFLRRFRRRRLLAFLRREHLYATLDALGGETRLFLNARTLQTMLADCRWEEARRDSVEWQFLRIQAALIVKELVINTPEFSHLLRLPRYPVNPECMMPVWFGCRRKHQRKIIGRMPASLLAHCFLPKERCPSPKKQGIPGAPVVPCIGRNCGLLSANAVTEHLSQEDCHSESVASTEHSPTTRELCPLYVMWGIPFQRRRKKTTVVPDGE
ncbi:hypothetical protein OsI_31362 [Oryza sativa Indica Group]|uniref:Uncharacterized protein n=1 Tax=Oryza sativa subsp. indica TaxID=39946 RepID=A2Z185_ORYSI|nr:hypothetical protein OsI_31362 [Oryza sativa Indica Group]